MAGSILQPFSQAPRDSMQPVQEPFQALGHKTSSRTLIRPERSSPTHHPLRPTWYLASHPTPYPARPNHNLPIQTTQFHLSLPTESHLIPSPGNGPPVTTPACILESEQRIAAQNYATQQQSSLNSAFEHSQKRYQPPSKRRRMILGVIGSILLLILLGIVTIVVDLKVTGRLYPYRADDQRCHVFGWIDIGTEGCPEKRLPGGLY